MLVSVFNLTCVQWIRCHNVCKWNNSVQITDNVLSYLATNCPNLEHLVSSRCVMHTSHYPNIRLNNYIDCLFLQLLVSMFLIYCLQSFSHCELLTDEGIRSLSGGGCAIENLKVIELDNCPLITDVALDQLM